MAIGFARWPLLIVFATLASCTFLPTAPSQERLARVEVLALLQTLNVDLISHDSATLTLERWCADHHLAESPRIVARQMRDAVKPIPGDLRARLAVDAVEPIAYRHVKLICGEHVLSEADNWYVARRLTTEMNQRLDNSDEPFGKVVQSLGFQRRMLSAELLWSPLPVGWEMSAKHAQYGYLHMPTAVLRHEAILYTSAQVPFSAVVETYTSQMFAFGTWATFLNR